MKLGRADPFSKAFVRVMLPRNDSDTSQSRPFDIIFSDLDVLAEFNTERKVNPSSLFPVFILNLHFIAADNFDCRSNGLSCNEYSEIWSISTTHRPHFPSFIGKYLLLALALSSHIF